MGVRFIKKNGRVIPIRDGGSQGSRPARKPSGAAGKAQHIKHLNKSEDKFRNAANAMMLVGGLGAGAAAVLGGRGKALGLAAGVLGSAAGYASLGGDVQSIRRHWNQGTNIRGIGQRFVRNFKTGLIGGAGVAGGVGLTMAGMSVARKLVKVKTGI